MDIVPEVLKTSATPDDVRQRIEQSAALTNSFSHWGAIAIISLTAIMLLVVFCLLFYICFCQRPSGTATAREFEFSVPLGHSAQTGNTTNQNNPREEDTESMYSTGQSPLPTINYAARFCHAVGINYKRPTTADPSRIDTKTS